MYKTSVPEPRIHEADSGNNPGSGVLSDNQIRALEWLVIRPLAVYELAGNALERARDHVASLVHKHLDDGVDI